MRFSFSGAARSVRMAVLALAAAAAPAVAQPGGDWAQRELYSPSFTSRDIKRYADILGLTQEQRALMDELFEGYQEDFRLRSAAAREKVEKMREAARNAANGEGRGNWREIMSQAGEFRQVRADMEKGFLGDVQALLTPEQQERWGRVDRVRRRETTIGRGMLSGERMDVIKLVEEAELPEDVRSTLSATLEQYEADLDRALIERNKMQEEARQRFMTGMREGRQMDDPKVREEMQSMFERGREVSVRVRETNKRYARLVQDALPEDRRATFESAVRKAQFPEVYREPRTLRDLNKAVTLADLTEEQKEPLLALKAGYERDLSALNERMSAAWEQAEGGITLESMMGRWRGGGGMMDEGPVAEIRDQRRALSDRTTEAMKKLLRPEQMERLPSANEEEEDRGGENRERRMRRIGSDPT